MMNEVFHSTVTEMLGNAGSNISDFQFMGLATLFYERLSYCIYVACSCLANLYHLVLHLT